MRGRAITCLIWSIKSALATWLQNKYQYAAATSAVSMNHSVNRDLCWLLVELNIAHYMSNLQTSTTANTPYIERVGEFTGQDQAFTQLECLVVILPYTEGPTGRMEQTCHQDRVKTPFRRVYLFLYPSYFLIVSLFYYIACPSLPLLLMYLFLSYSLSTSRSVARSASFRKYCSLNSPRA